MKKLSTNKRHFKSQLI